MIVVLDTNFLIYVAKYKINLFSELDRICPGCKLVVPSSVVAEIRKLKESKERHATLTLSLLHKFIKEKKISVKSTFAKNADAAIIELAQVADTVATMDKLLAERARKLGKSIIKIRQKKYLIKD